MDVQSALQLGWEDDVEAGRLGEVDEHLSVPMSGLLFWEEVGVY